MNRVSISLLVAATLVAGAACRGGKPAATVTPSPTAYDAASAAVTNATAVSPPPAAAPTRAPFLAVPGSAIYLRANVLYLGALDGSGEEALTAGAFDCGAGCTTGTGSAGDADVGGATLLYYTASLGPLERQDYSLRTSRYALLRRPVAGGETQRLLEFDGFADARGSGIASVSPDGQHVAYAAIDGLRRFDVATSATVLLLPNTLDCARQESPGGPCQVHSDPRWSPRGDWLVARRNFYEGSRPVLLRPLDADPLAIQLEAGGNFAAWSPDGAELCMSETDDAAGGAGILSPDDRVFHKLTPQLAGSAYALGCAWSADGNLAIGYRRADNSGGVVFFDAKSVLVRDIALASGDLILADWLPDGRGVVASWAAGEERPRSWIILTDGTTRALPIYAGWVLAVLP